MRDDRDVTPPPATAEPSARRVLPSGPHAWLVETDDPVGLMATIAATDPPVGLVDVVPGARTVLVTLADAAERAVAGHWLGSLTPTAVAAGQATTVTIPVRYDGADLDDVARATGLRVDEVIERHQGVTYVSAFCGFAPGFAYLTGLDASLVLPRRATPRTRVPAGAVAIAAAYTAVYPHESPGGWHLLGRTDVALWDLAGDPPARLAPGTHVRFVADT